MEKKKLILPWPWSLIRYFPRAFSRHFLRISHDSGCWSIVTKNIIKFLAFHAILFSLRENLDLYLFFIIIFLFISIFIFDSVKW